jgi:hypothetical protein
VIAAAAAGYVLVFRLRPRTVWRGRHVARAREASAGTMVADAPEEA